jgi:hypothetical protein
VSDETPTPIEIFMDRNVIITAITLDHNFVITGDNNGLLTVRQLADGKVLEESSKIQLQIKSKLTGNPPSEFATKSEQQWKC